MLTPLFEYQLEAVSKNDSDRYLNMKAIDKFEKERETRQEPAEKGGGEKRESIILIVMRLIIDD